jgi:predicted Zn-dependent protease
LVNTLYNTILGGEPALLQENSLQLASIIWTAQHSRKDEREADRLAVEYLLETGVNPQGIVTLLESFLREDAHRMDELGRLESLLSTHPLTRTRIADAQADIERLNEETIPATTIDLRAFPIFRGLVLESAPQLLELAPQ